MKKLIIASAMILSIVGTSAIAAPDGTFRQAHEYGYGDKSSLDPASRGRVMQITEKLMSRLIRPNMKGSPSPDLATSWSSNEAATEWTLKLRSGVAFHDGSSFEAADVLYTLNRVLDPENKSPARSAIKMIEKNGSARQHDCKIYLVDTFRRHAFAAYGLSSAHHPRGVW